MSAPSADETTEDYVNDADQENNGGEKNEERPRPGIALGRRVDAPDPADKDRTIELKSDD